MSLAPISPRKIPAMRSALLSLALFCVLIVAGLIIATQFARPLALHWFTAHTGRDIRVAGDFRLHLLSNRPSLTMSAVQIGNPRWMAPGETVSAATVVLTLEWQLASIPLRIGRLEVHGADLHLTREADGRANWHMNPEGPGRGPPLIRSLEVPEARIELHDARRHVEFTGIVSALDRIQDGQVQGLRIEGKGRLNGRDASFILDGDALAGVRRDQPYHFAVRETSGSAHLSAEGELPKPFDMRMLQATFAISGADMSDTYYLVGLHLPATAAFHLRGRLERDGKRFLYRDLEATSGRSDLSGTLTVDSSSGRARVQGALKSRMLQLADLGKGAAQREASADSGATAATSAAPLPLAALGRSDWRVSFEAKELQLGTQALKSVSASLFLEHGLLRIEHLGATLAGGSITGEAQLDAASSPPRAALMLSVKELQLEQLTHTDPPPLSGTLTGRIKLSGEGKSLQELLSTANGTAAALIPGGALRASMAELSSLDLNGALGTLLKSRDQTPIRCGVASFQLQDGTATARSLLLDTQNVLIAGSGTIQMDSQTLDLTLRGHPKKPRLALRSAVRIQGTLRRPEFHLAGGNTLAQAGMAAGLGVVLTPLAAILAFINPGLAHDADCTQLLQQAAQGAAADTHNLAQAHP